MPTILRTGIVIAIGLLWRSAGLAQSNDVYSFFTSASTPLTGYLVAVVSVSPIWVVGSAQNRFGIEECSYWTDSRDSAIPWPASRVKQPGDIQHRYTRFRFGQFAISLPLSPRIEPWNAVFLAGLMAYLTIRHVFGRRTRDNEKAVSRADATDWTLLIIVMAGSLLLPVLYLATPWFAFADYRLPAVAPWCGMVLMIAALWLFWRSHADLGQNWSVTLELRQGHQLVTQGVYRSIRHPMYASTWLWCLAQGLVLQNWLAGWSALVAFALLYFVRTPREEQMMCEFFGQEYRDYMRQTGRLFPRLRVKHDA